MERRAVLQQRAPAAGSYVPDLAVVLGPGLLSVEGLRNQNS